MACINVLLVRELRLQAGILRYMGKSIAWLIWVELVANEQNAYEPMFALQQAL